MYCHNCGEEIKDGTAICEHCGATQQDDPQMQLVATVLRGLSGAIEVLQNTLKELEKLKELEDKA